MELDDKELEATRNRKCEYCQEEKPIFCGLGLTVSSTENIIIRNKNLMFLFRNEGHNLWDRGKLEKKILEINYCPMCR